MQEIVLHKTDIELDGDYIFDKVKEKKYMLLPMPKGRKTDSPTIVRFAFDGERLHILFKAFYAGELSKKYSKKSGKVYRSDCVELFIAFEEDFKQYYELDLSPYNKAFFGKVTNEDDENLFCEKWEGRGVFTRTRIENGFYEVEYVLSLKEFLTLKRSIFVNLFRVEMSGNKRFSQALNPPNYKSHHIKSAFVKINIE